MERKPQLSESTSSEEESSAKSNKEHLFEVEADTWRNVTLYEKKEKYEPSGRYGHTAFEVSNDGFSAMYVLGGGDARGQFCRELLEFDFESLSFLPPSEVKLFEHGRHFHSTVVFNKCLFVFGGKSNGYYNDVHCLDTMKNKWVKLEVKGTVPSRRYGHSACVWKNKMVVFGGYDNDGFTSNEIFMFDLQQHSWELIVSKSQSTPAPRFHHTCVVVHDKMYLFGGRDADNHVWIFDLIEYTWRELTIKGAKPSARYGHTWTWVGGNLAPTLLMFGGTNGKDSFNQLWSFNLAKNSWKSLVNDKKNNAPDPRYFHSALVMQGFLLVFGGRNNQDLAFNDFIKLPIRVSVLSWIPEEIMMKVFEKLDLVSLSRANSVSKQWNQLTNDGLLWRDLILWNDETKANTKVHSGQHYKKVLKTIKAGNKQKAGWGVPETNAVSVKIVVVGCGAVGKTSFLIRYTSRIFPQEYIPTVFDNYTAQKIHNNIPVAVSLWDVSGGGEDYDRLRPLSYPFTDVFLMMFSLVSPTAYENMAAKWYPEVNHHAPDAYKLLVGSKADLRDDPDAMEKLKQKGLAPITDEQAEQLRQRIEAKAYIPCSSLTGYNVDHVIDTALTLALEKIFSNDNVLNKKNRCLVM
jgi:Ras-related C3 botulinum toxin substrate 1